MNVFYILHACVFFSFFLHLPLDVSVLFGRSCKRKWERERGRERRGEEEGEKDTDLCGLCTAVVCNVDVVLSYAFLIFFIVKIDKKIVTFFFLCKKKESNGSSSIWFFSVNLSFFIILDTFLFTLLTSKSKILFFSPLLKVCFFLFYSLDTVDHKH